MTRHRGRSHKWLGAVGVAAVVSLAGMGASATITTSAPATAQTGASLRAAARAWAEAFLTGTAGDIMRMQGPECHDATAPTFSREFKATYLRGLRAMLRRHLGKPLDEIKVLGVDVRNVTSTRGEAQVRYDLPAAKVGNDNWVEFTLHGGRWKVSNCHAPIGGESSTSTAANSVVTTTT